MRELSHPRAKGASVSAETRLFGHVQHQIAQSRNSGGFVGRAIAQLAFTLRAHGRRVEVITAHYDSDIAHAEQTLHRHVPSLQEIRFQDYLDHEPEHDHDAAIVPLLRIHGRPGDPSAQSIVLGEADFLADEHISPVGHTAEHMSRYRLLARALTEGAVVFVGTSLSDPGVLGTLAATRHFHKRRYAVLLPPREVVDAALSHQEIELGLRLLSLRYLHLGVGPIWADFAHQIPQLLREVALSVFQGARYTGYAERLGVWWDRWSHLFGFDAQGEWIGRSDQQVRGVWESRCRSVRDAVESERSIGQVALSKESFRIEVWLRNHHKRALFLWATSARGRSSAGTPEVVHLRDEADDAATQRAFRTGQSIAQPIRRGRWRYCISTNVILYGDPWHRLPIGIVTVLSDRSTGALSEIAAEADALREFETEMSGFVRELLGD